MSDWRILHRNTKYMYPWAVQKSVHFFGRHFWWRSVAFFMMQRQAEEYIEMRNKVVAIYRGLEK